MTPNLRNTISYIENNTFKGMVFDDPTGMVISGKQFAIARLTDYGICPSYEALVKFIEENGGIVKERAVKSADYLIVTPLATKSSTLVYKEEKDKYEKAVMYRKTSVRPRIIRDIDFFIACDMFSKIKIDDKRRLIMEYARNAQIFNEKTKKKILSFLTSKGKDDPYLKTQNLKMLNLNTSNNETVGNTILLIPDEKESSAFSLQNWRKYFSLSEGQRAGKKGLLLKKCKALNASIRVPGNIDGNSVVAIDRNAFSNLGEYAKEIYLPDTVVYIENNAFSDCSALQKVVIEAAFVNCPYLKEILVCGINIAMDERKEYGQIKIIPVDQSLLSKM